MGIEQAEAIRVRIDLHPSEIVDIVEEQLSWLAIASSKDGGEKRYVGEDFRRAESVIDLGNGAGGWLNAKGVDAVDVTELRRLSRAARVDHNRDYWRRAGLVRNHFLSTMGERMRFAQIIQCDPKAATGVWCGGAAGLRDSDYADSADRDAGWFNNLIGVQYKLRSISVCKKEDAERLNTGRTTRGMRVVVFQEVVAMKDGRSACLAQCLALDPAGTLRWLDTGKDVKYVNRKKYGDLTNPFDNSFSEFVANAFARRIEWTVELALTKERTGIGLPTDGEGARAIVAALGRETTRAGRRKALVHWVSEHYRRKRSSAELSLVRQHMRGATTCEAGGFAVRIYPARVDIEAAVNGKRFDSEAAAQ